MANFGVMKITNLGMDLYTKIQTGSLIQFTKIQSGDGVLPGSTNIEELTALVSPKFDVSIESFQVDNENHTVRIKGTKTNDGLLEGNFSREIGLFATDPDIGEILYAYANAGEYPDYIPPISTGPYSKTFVINAAIGNATNVTAIVPTDIYVTKESFDLFKSEIDTQVTDFVNETTQTLTTFEQNINASLEGIENTKIAKPVTATGDNLAAYDTDQDALKDSGISISDVVNARVGATIKTISSSNKYILPGWRKTANITGGYQILTSSILYVPIYVEKETTYTGIASYHSNTNNANIIVGLYNWVDGRPQSKIKNIGNIIGGTTTGTKETAISLTLQKGLYFLGYKAYTDIFDTFAAATSYYSVFFGFSDAPTQDDGYLSFLQTGYSTIAALPSTVGTLIDNDRGYFSVMLKEA